MRVNEKALLGYCLNHGALRSPEDVFSLAATLDTSTRDGIVAALSSILESEQALGHVSSEAAAIPTADDFKSIIKRETDEAGKIRQLVTFSFTDAATEALFPLLGLALAVFSHTVTIDTAASVIAAGKALWTNLGVLKRPDNNIEIDTLEALLKTHARTRAAGGRDLPTTQELIVEVGLPAATVESALATLERKHVVRGKDFSAPKSAPTKRWAVRL